MFSGSKKYTKSLIFLLLMGYVGLGCLFSCKKKVLKAKPVYIHGKVIAKATGDSLPSIQILFDGNPRDTTDLIGNYSFNFDGVRVDRVLSATWTDAQPNYDVCSTPRFNIPDSAREWVINFALCPRSQPKPPPCTCSTGH